MAKAKPLAKGKESIKRLQINKSQSTMLAVIVVSVIISIFGLFAAKALVVKGLYQRRVLNERRNIAVQLKDNLESANKLFAQYKVFAEEDPNILSGQLGGPGTLDGDNARIVLDALPSKYDAPALAASIEKVLTGRNLFINSLSLTDDPVANSDTPEAEPTAKPVAFSFVGSTTFKGASNLLKDFERSIRPFDLNIIQISGADNDLQLSVNMTTYFQPAKSLDLQPTKEVE